jgi:hypothetical protein
MKLTWDDVLIEGRQNLKFQVKIPNIAYSTGVPNLAHFFPPGVGFKIQNAIQNRLIVIMTKTQRHFDRNT